MRLIAFVAVALVVTACGGSSDTIPTGTTPTGATPTTQTPTATTSVSLVNVAFSPSSILVTTNAIVTFTNNDAITHNVTFDNTSIGGTGNFSSGAKTLTMPATPGTYTFKCTIHAAMTGTVTVQ